MVGRSPASQPESLRAFAAERKKMSSFEIKTKKKKRREEIWEGSEYDVDNSTRLANQTTEIAEAVRGMLGLINPDFCSGCKP